MSRTQKRKPSVPEAEINILDLAADEGGHGAQRALGRRLPAMTAQLLKAAGIAARHASATVNIRTDEGKITKAWAVSAGILEEGKAIELSHRMGRARFLAFGELGPSAAAGMTVKLRVLRRDDAAEVLRFERSFFEEEAAEMALRLARELSQLLDSSRALLDALDIYSVLGTRDSEALLRLQEGLDGLTAWEGQIQGADLGRAIEHFIGTLERDATCRPALDQALASLGSGIEHPLGLDHAIELTTRLREAVTAPEATILLARLHRRRGELGRAKTILATSLSKNEQDNKWTLTIVAELAQVLSDLDLLDEAIDLCQKYLELQGDKNFRANIYEELGLVLARSSRFQEARKALEEAISLDPHRPRALANLGRCHHLLGSVEASRDAYERSLELNPYAWEVLRNYAELLAETGHMQRSVALLKQWADQRPNDPLPTLALGELMTSQGQASEAVSLLRKAVSIHPKDQRLHAMLGGVLTQIQDYVAAEKAYRDALSCSPNDPALLSNLAVVLSHLGQLPAAEQFARRAVELDPQDPVSHKVLEHIRAKN